MVVAEGVTTFVPEAATDPMLGLIETLVAPVVFQDKVAEPPGAIVVGVAEILDVGAPGLEATLYT